MAKKFSMIESKALLVKVKLGVHLKVEEEETLLQLAKQQVEIASHKKFVEMILNGLGEERLTEDLIDNLESWDTELLIDWIKEFHPFFKKKNYDSRRTNNKGKN